MPKAFRPLVELRARYKAFYSGRGCAKSTSFAIATILQSTQRPLRVLCCREVQKTIRESVKHDLDKAIERAGLSRVFLSTKNTISNANGSHFIFEGLQSGGSESARAFKIQSMSDIDVVWIEEAQSISRRSLDILIPTVRKNGSEIWFAWNPNTPKDPVDFMFRGPDRITEQEVPDELKAYYDRWAIVVPLQLDDNPFFPEVLRVERERDRIRDPDKFKHVWLGEYAHRSDAAVFNNWSVGTVDVSIDERPYYGADWGFSVDPTVLVRTFIFPDKRLLYIDAEVSGVGIAIDHTPALFDSICDHDDTHPWWPRKWPIMADSSWPQTVNYMMTHGYPELQYAKKGAGSVEEGINFIKTYDVVINPNCKRCIDEFTYYSYERDKLTDEVLPKLKDDKNHVIDAIRYAIETVRRNVVLIAFPEVVKQKIDYPGAPKPETNPALSPAGRTQQRERGVIW